MSEPLELRVVRGRPDHAELAALTTVLLAAAARPAGGGTGAGRRPLWGDPATLVRPGTAPAPGGWSAPRL